MYKVTVIDLDQEKHEYENVQGFHYPAGVLHLDFQDGSSTAFAPGQWLEVDVERMDNPQVGDYQL